MTRIPYPWFAGLDLGQSADYSALVIVEESMYVSEAHRMRINVPAGWVSPATPLTPWQFNELLTLQTQELRPPDAPLSVRHIQRWPLHTSYPDIIRDVAALIDTRPLQEGCVALVVDKTGCGAPVVDAMREAGLRPIPTLITAGNVATVEHGEARVPKRDLVAVMSVLLERRRLQIDRNLAEAPTLTRELQKFRRRVTPQGHDSYASWREKDHDDVVLATSLACWWRGYWNGYLDEWSAQYWDKPAIPEPLNREHETPRQRWHRQQLQTLDQFRQRLGAHA